MPPRSLRGGSGHGQGGVCGCGDANQPEEGDVAANSQAHQQVPGLQAEPAWRAVLGVQRSAGGHAQEADDQELLEHGGAELRNCETGFGGTGGTELGDPLGWQWSSYWAGLRLPGSRRGERERVGFGLPERLN